MNFRPFALFLLLALGSIARSETTYVYNGDQTPSTGVYASWFTTLGPGHPTGSYFGGTTWSSNGSYLTMTTQNPNDYVGATSQGIWFGLGYGYGDDPGIGFVTASLGNSIVTRLALAANSSEWSLYWFDGSGYEAALNFYDNGFVYFRAGGGTFVPVADMTSFHTYGTYLYNGIATYSFDGVLVGEGPAITTGTVGLMIFGDPSATDVSGYGSLLVDSLTLSMGTGAPTVIPEPASLTLACGALAGLAAIGARRRRWAAPASENQL